MPCRRNEERRTVVCLSSCAGEVPKSPTFKVPRSALRGAVKGLISRIKTVTPTDQSITYVDKANPIIPWVYLGGEMTREEKSDREVFPRCSG